jgi:hypothetical protein
MPALSQVSLLLVDHVDRADTQKEKRLQRAREYYHKNREKILRQKQEYIQKNREKVRESKQYIARKNSEQLRKYRELNRKQRSLYNQEYYQKNSEKLRKYREKNIERIRDYRQQNIAKMREYRVKNREKIRKEKPEDHQKFLAHQREYRRRKIIARGLPPPRNYSSWKSVEEVRNFFEKFSELHFIKHWPEDWYRISLKQVELAGGTFFIPSSHFLSLFSFPPLPHSSLLPSKENRTERNCQIQNSWQSIKNGFPGGQLGIVQIFQQREEINAKMVWREEKRE